MKAILVTGANSGIGYYTARRLAANGFYVYAGIRKESNLNRFKGIDNIQPIKLDVTSQYEIDFAVTCVDELYGIVNNAGVTTFADMNDMQESEMRRIFDTNVFGPYRINKSFSPKLSNGGRTVTIGSISGYISSAGAGAYSMSKFALEGYTDAYAQEMIKSGIHVSIIEPGGYKTNILRNVNSGMLSDEVNRSLQRTLKNNDNYKKDPHDVADAVLEVMTSTNPKRRYLVVPDERQAKLTIGAAMQKVVELNDRYSRDDLVKMLDLLLAESSFE